MAMKQLAAMMMFAAWLLYGAMPAVAMPSMPHAMSGSAIIAHAVLAGSRQDHSGHPGTADETAQDMALPGSSPMHGDIGQAGAQPCLHSGPEGAKICVAPFCSACLVVLPDIAFSDTGRFVHRYPAPEAGPSLVVSGTAPLTPPPRA